MTTPATIPSKYTDSPTAILISPSGPSDTPRLVENTVTIPDTSSVGTVFGLVPFQKGATMDYGAVLAIADLDSGTDVTLNWGYHYIDVDTVNSIEDPNAFASAATTAQAGGLLRPTATEGAKFVAGSDGWITVSIAAGPTTTAGDITFKGMIAYGITT